MIGSPVSEPTLLLMVFVLRVSLFSSACRDDRPGFVHLNLSPGKMAFDTIDRGAVVRRDVFITHTGTAGTVVLDAIHIDTDSGDLSIGSLECPALKPGDRCRIQIVYASNGDAPDYGVLSMGTNIPGTPVIEIPILTPGSRGMPSARPSSVDFGGVEEGKPKGKKRPRSGPSGH